MRTSAYYNGCIDGFINQYEMSMYRRPAYLKTAMDAFGAVKIACQYRAMIFHYNLYNENNEVIL